MTNPLTERRLSDEEPYEIIHNPVVGEEFRLLERDSDADGEFLRAEVRYRSDATRFVEHVHPQQDETFHVLDGALLVSVDGVERSLTPGEQVTLPAGVPHEHGTVQGTETRVLWEARPPLAAATLLRMLATLAEEGNTDARGTPNLLAMAVFADTHSDFIYLARPSIPTQKLLFKLLAPVGRLRGYSTDYPAPSGAPSA
ncbi:cupin domain-containing protein [Salinirubellus salinus]|jgi:mannose-6-phosphate isomerase-like protein (cupin superfamily)|uniref:Cupin domain-containing protein n=1 Tax=Salinirubellus salinus TaxID=1364945 RepID=A0A9E7R132_9EURY|nr:cupin domain-containing protein [Salinirubellus salinus]UWM53714.1 cupin domain-containing protein [Salinirubellus salinus]